MPKLMPVARAGHAESLPSTPAQPDATDRIREKVLAALGEPPDLLRVQVKPLWGSYYRANVFVGRGFTPRMAHSYFLDVDDGEIVSSAPPIQRLY
jgi:hypothetical protein